MPDWKRWRDMADESIKAGRELKQDCPRSAVSRFYYAAYQAGTALLLYRKQQPPETREAWSHADTPEMLKEHLLATVKSKDKVVDLTERLRQLYKVRLNADYAGDAQTTQAIADKARKEGVHC